MSVKSFLSKLKWNSKIAEGDDNMFIELKTATPLFMVYLQKKKVSIYSRAQARVSHYHSVAQLGPATTSIPSQKRH